MNANGDAPQREDNLWNEKPNHGVAEQRWKRNRADEISAALIIRRGKKRKTQHRAALKRILMPRHADDENNPGYESYVKRGRILVLASASSLDRLR